MNAIAILPQSITSLSAQSYIILAGIILAVVLIWLIVLTILIVKNLLWNRSVFGDTKKENLREILQEHIDRVGVVQIKLNDLESVVRKEQKAGLRHIQKVGIVRFNPFEDTGGDQSFVVAVLDAEDNGLVISSLHGRERTRMYAKPVRKGKPGNYPFSDEEEKAITNAREGMKDSSGQEE